MRSSRVCLFLLITAAAFSVKAPFAAQRFRLFPDAIAYTNIARNFAEGNGFTSTLKLNYFDSTPVTHSAWPDWPPLYPLAAGLMMRAGLDEIGLQVANAVLCAIVAGLVFLITDRLFDRRSALVAGAFAAISLNTLRASLSAMSDPLGLVLALAAVLAALHAGDNRWTWFCGGALAGAACLTRYPNAVLLPAIGVYALACSGRRALLLLGAGLAAVVCPILAWKWTECGSPLYTVQAFHYTCASFNRSAWLCSGPQHEVGGPDLSAVWRNSRYLATNLLRTATGLHLLGVGLVAAILRMRRGVLAGGRWLLAATAAANFAVYALTPSLPAAQGARFLLLTYCLLLPFCAEGIASLLAARRATARTAAIAVCAAAAAIYVTGYTSPFNTAFEMREVSPHIAQRVRSAVPHGHAIATNNPWLLSRQTGLPTAALPHNLDRAGLRRFIRDYDIGAIVVLKSKRDSLTVATIKTSGDLVRVAEVSRAWIAVPKRTDDVAYAVTPGRAPGPRRRM